MNSFLRLSPKECQTWSVRSCLRERKKEGWEGGAEKRQSLPVRAERETGEARPTSGSKTKTKLFISFCFWRHLVTPANVFSGCLFFWKGLWGVGEGKQVRGLED